MSLLTAFIDCLPYFNGVTTLSMVHQTQDTPGKYLVLPMIAYGATLYISKLKYGTIFTSILPLAYIGYHAKDIITISAKSSYNIFHTKHS